jgi:hypothetical protein
MNAHARVAIEFMLAGEFPMWGLPFLLLVKLLYSIPDRAAILDTAPLE